MAVIVETARISGPEAVTVFTAATDCTVSVDVTNCGEEEATVRLVYTPTPANPEAGHVLEARTLVAPGGGLSRNGLPVKSGWSFVLAVLPESGETGEAGNLSGNLSALVSGYTVEA